MSAGTNRIITPLIVVFILATTAPNFAGQIIYVDDDGPADFNNIQAAIYAAYDGDTVIIADGIYSGSGHRYIDFLGKAITLRSENGPENCIIDCKGTGRGFYFRNGEDANSVLEGLTITNGYENSGGGIYCESSSPTIANCIIRDNSAQHSGGGMNNYSGSPTVLNCKFYSNSANYGGGGMSNVYNSPNVVNCQFIGNSADRGGGMYNSWVDSSLNVLNCAFSGNSAGNGGAMYNFYCDPTIINCTFSVNSSWSGGMVNWHRSSPTITNCIFWGNFTFYGQMDESAQLNDGIPIVNYCCIQGWTGNLGGTGNFGDDPLFVEALGADNIPGTEDDNPRLLAGSPALDVGDNLAVPPSLLTDLDGNPRFINSNVDMGAYEGPKQGFLLSTQSITVPESQTATFTVALATDPLQTVQVAVNYHSGDLDITVQSGTLLTFNPSNYSYPQTVTLAAAEDADYLHGKALIWVSATAFVTAALDATEVDNDVPAVLYVDTDAPGASDGTSWENAFINLQDAISIAVKYHEVREIRVAKGIYKPDQGAGITPGDKTVTFQLKNSVAIKGGYAGFGEADPNARDIDENKTILSGDLAGDDIELNNPADMWGEQSRRNNSGHVVTGSYVDANAILDGFTITAGYNSGLGAGLYSRDGNSTVTNCTFSWNCAEWGGGMGIWNSSPKVIDCKFVSNAAMGGGGLDNVENSNPILINCTFSHNSGLWRGGGMLNGYAGVGGPANPILINCIFNGNSTDRYGGGMYNEYSSPIITNCTFTGNAAERGGGICSDRGSSPTLTNCILWSNKATYGHEIYLPFYSEQRPSEITVSFSDVQGGAEEVYVETGSILNWEVGNIDADPLFVVPGHWDSYSWVDGDYNLLEASPCIDTGDPNYLSGPTKTDLDGKPRVMGNRIDMGAYEYSPAIMAFVRIVPRTINLANKSNWITTFLWLPEEYNVADLNPNSVFLEDEIQPEQLLINEQGQVAIAKFSREDVQGILKIGEIELKITAQLKDATCFEGTDVIKVIYEGGGKLAKLGNATDPNPPDGATDVGIDADLSWTPAPEATSRDVYFGVTNPPQFIGNQTATTFDPALMAFETTYYWRIDEINKWGKTAGTVWTFKTNTIGPPPLPPW